MSKKEQVIVGNFIEEYLHKRKQIALIIFLVDIRHKPTENDKLMYNYIISSKIPFIIIANKADKIAVTKVDAATQEIQKALNPIGDITTLPFSSERRIYTENVWNEIEKYMCLREIQIKSRSPFSTYKHCTLGDTISRNLKLLVHFFFYYTFF